MAKKIIIAIIIIFGAIQLIPVTEHVETLPDTDQDFIAMVQPPKEVSSILLSACYDCHSNKPTYPWYAELAPISWWIDDHVNEGRGHLNFSEWGGYEAKKADHKLEECVEMLENGEMPLESYTWMHEDARLTPDQRSAMVNYFKDLRQELAAQ